MINLGKFKAGAIIFYGANFHNDQGTIENPTSPEAQQKTPAGVWSDITAPAIQNAKIGHYGGTINTTGFAAGQYIIRMAGIVATAKTVATEFCFEIEAVDNADINEKTVNLPASPAAEDTVNAVGNAVVDVGNAVINLGSPMQAGAKVALSDATEGQIDDIQDALYNGKWVINPTAKTLTIYKSDGVTVLKVINLTSTSAIIPTFIQGVPQ